MSVLSATAVTLSRDEVKDYADVWTSFGAEGAEEDLGISGTRYLLFSEDQLHTLIESVILDLNSPAED